MQLCVYLEGANLVSVLMASLSIFQPTGPNSVLRYMCLWPHSVSKNTSIAACPQAGWAADP